MEGREGKPGLEGKRLDKESGGDEIVVGRENGSINICLDAFSLCFFPLLIFSLLDCFLKRLILPKILIVLKVTHRQVGKVNPRPQILDSNLVKGYATRIPLKF